MSNKMKLNPKNPDDEDFILGVGTGLWIELLIVLIVNILVRFF